MSVKPIPPPYSLGHEQAASVMDVEFAFGTSRLLPALDAIPTPFQNGTGEASI